MDVWCGRWQRPHQTQNNFSFTVLSLGRHGNVLAESSKRSQFPELLSLVGLAVGAKPTSGFGKIENFNNRQWRRKVFFSKPKKITPLTQPHAPRPLALVDVAQRIAIAAHTGQRYGMLPYTNHLQSVADLACKYAKSAELNTEILVSAAWLHDAIEDTDITAADIAVHCGDAVASLVWELTAREDESADLSRNTEFTRLSKMSPAAKFLKWCDLAANMTACVKSKSEYLGGYIAAFSRYEKALGVGVCPPLRKSCLHCVLLGTTLPVTLGFVADGSLITSVYVRDTEEEVEIARLDRWGSTYHA